MAVQSESADIAHLSARYDTLKPSERTGSWFKSSRAIISSASVTGVSVFKQVQAALRHTDLLIQPDIPPAGYLPGSKAADLMIEAGERAACLALSLPLTSRF
jgi:hypothetical protein